MTSKAQQRNHRNRGFSPGYVVTALLQSCVIWKQLGTLGASQVSSALLPQMSSTGFLQIPISLHPKSTRGKWGVRLFIFEGDQNHIFCMSAQHILWSRDSVIQPGHLGSSSIFWSAGTPASPKGSPSMYIAYPEPTFNKLVFQQHRRCYFTANQNQACERTIISGEESQHFSF